jgi:protein tyrosine phosphatase (PTP) superfamily phosphohydrolase (DUF442 family)
MDPKPQSLTLPSLADATGQESWRPEFSWLLDDLAVGGSFPRGAAAALARDGGVGAIIDVRIEEADHAEELAACGLRFLHLPTEDVCGVSPEMLDAGVAFAREIAAGGGKLLIHCRHGIGRSALVALCVLVDRGYSPMDALALAKDAREKISPSRAQFGAWVDWIAREAPGRPPPDFEAFAQVVYRPPRHRA